MGGAGLRHLRHRIRAADRHGGCAGGRGRDLAAQVARSLARTPKETPPDFRPVVRAAIDTTATEATAADETGEGQSKT